MKGFKTVLASVLLAVLPAMVTSLAGVDWQTLGIKPWLAAVLGGVFGGLRLITDSPVFKSLPK